MSCDLHCHSKISDGSLGIEELLAIARRRGLSAVSVTDHDAVVGATRAVVVGKRLGIPVIHGVEMSAYDPARGRKVHILGYLCDAPDRLEGMCRQMALTRKAAATEMIRKVLRYYPITPEMIARCAAGSTTIYKQHIMHALIDAGYADGFYGEVYQKLFSSTDGCAFVATEYPDVYRVIDLIHSAGGLAVLAHPTTYDSLDLMQELTEKSLVDGIEVWHPSAGEKRTEELSQFAERFSLIKTGGSDFHGMYNGSPRPLGFRGAPDNTPKLMVEYKRNLANR